ncbi:MAG: hypothetical protein GY830_09360 [Bacteroidetes bacterium]|nr:hypothetical protein [Bacteroidota bacterium]
MKTYCYLLNILINVLSCNKTYENNLISKIRNKIFTKKENIKSYTNDYISKFVDEKSKASMKEKINLIIDGFTKTTKNQIPADIIWRRCKSPY